MRMKTFLKTLTVIIFAIILMPAYSSADNSGRPIANSELPKAAQTFLAKYYPSVTYTSKLDKDEYEVDLSNGHSVDFSLKGEWLDVEAPEGRSVPAGFYPAAIDSYVKTNYKGVGINEISREKGELEVELVNGVELIFSSAGKFIRSDSF